MRVLFELTADADASYDKGYHNRVRARVWDALKDTPYDKHGSPTPGFAFSNPFLIDDDRRAFDDPNEGDTYNLIVASPYEQQLAHITADFLDDPHIHAGTMPFTIADAKPVHTDVGPPGTQGVLETATGVYAITPPQYLSEETLDKHDEDTFWRHKEHPLAAFQNYVETQLQRKHEAFMPDSEPGPADVADPPFESYDFIKDYWLDVEVGSGVTLRTLVTKWRFPYQVRDNTHRRHLNLALDVGIGGRTPLGFGFLNDMLDEKTQPTEQAVAAQQ